MNLQDPGPPLTSGDIKAFEREIDGRLPEDYKRFLLMSNGGMAEPTLGFRWNGKVNKLPGFKMLLPSPDKSLRRALRNLRELNVDGYLPIASTMNDEDICVAFRGNVGEVSLALYEYDNEVAMGAFMMPLANSFTEFRNMLFEIPEIHCPVQELSRQGTPEDLDHFLAEGNSIDTISKNGFSILCEAIKFDNMPMFKACIERGASLSKSIYIATCNRRPDLIKLLSEAGADVNERDEFGDKPLSYVAGTALPGEEGALNREIEDLLISLGATK
jgi:ankyrin repeat protein